MNATEFCELVERRLGWEVPVRNGARWKGLVVEAHKVNQRRYMDIDLYTWENLQLAVELLAREKKSRSPMGVFSHVQRALDLALDVEPDIEEEIRVVMRYETQRGDPEGWVTRFARADGHHRKVLLDAWREAVR